MPLLPVVAVALLDADGRILLQERPPGRFMAGWWEFPGGKIAEGETPEQALLREVREELGLSLEASCIAPFTFASHPYPEHHLLLALYICRTWSGAVEAREGQALRWLEPKRAEEQVRLLPANRPLIAALRSFL